jgi:hypothetical protein
MGQITCPSCEKGLIKCTKCGGRGSTGILLVEKCSLCGGKKMISCPNCGGTGKIKN